MPGKNTTAGCLFAASVLFGLLSVSPVGSGPAQAGTTSVPPAAGTTSVPAAAVGSGTLDCTQLEALWRAAGGSPAAAHMAAQIAMAESSGRQDATDADSNGTVDRGYWQINSIWGAESTYDPRGNARAAVAISGNGSNWGPWVTYQTGAYIGKC